MYLYEGKTFQFGYEKVGLCIGIWRLSQLASRSAKVAILKCSYGSCYFRSIHSTRWLELHLEPQGSAVWLYLLLYLLAKLDNGLKNLENAQKNL